MTDIDIPTLLAAQQTFGVAIEAAIRYAEQFMGLADVGDNAADDDERDVLLEEAYEDRFHCEVCIVRSVMECVWGPIETYLDQLEQALGITPIVKEFPSVSSLHVVE